MATIDDLIKSIVDCSQEERLERIRKIRLSRRTSKSPPKRSKTTTTKKKEVSLDAVLSNPELAKRLLAALKEGDDE